MPTNIEHARARHEEISSSNNFKKTKWYKWKDGKNTLRILPGYDPRYCEAQPDFTAPMPPNARDHFAIEVKKANKVGPNKRTVYLDPQKPGPLEEYIAQLERQGDEASKKEADTIRPKNRAMFFVIDRDAENEGPQCVDWNLIEYNKVLAMVADPEYGDIACPFRGVDLVIDYQPQAKSKSGFAQWTSILARRTATPLTTDGTYWHEWLGTDHFVVTGVGSPTDPDYIRACIEGRDTEFNQNRDAGTANAEHTVGPALPAAPGPAALGQFPTCQHPYSPDAKFWMTYGGQTIETTAKDIAAHVLSGEDPMIMPHDQSSSWAPASQYRFAVVHPAPAAPAAPAAPVAPAAPAAPAAPMAAAPPMPPMPGNPAVPQSAPSAAPSNFGAPAAPAAPPVMAAPIPSPAGGSPMTTAPQPSMPTSPALPPAPTVPAYPPSPAGGGDEVPFSPPPSEATALEQQLRSAANSGSQSVVGQDLRSALGG